MTGTIKLVSFSVCGLILQETHCPLPKPALTSCEAHLSEGCLSAKLLQYPDGRKRGSEEGTGPSGIAHTSYQKPGDAEP